LRLVVESVFDFAAVAAAVAEVPFVCFPAVCFAVFFAAASALAAPDRFAAVATADP